MVGGTQVEMKNRSSRGPRLAARFAASLLHVDVGETEAQSRMWDRYHVSHATCYRTFMRSVL